MQILIAGATGATGHLLVKDLLARGTRVKAIARSAQALRDKVGTHDGLQIIEGSILDIPPAQLASHVRDCQAVACCLGHPLSLRGIFGQPRRLVRDAVAHLCQAIQDNHLATPTRLVLMGSSGVRNLGVDKPVSLAERTALGLLRWTVPPHADNEEAAGYLQERIGLKDGAIQWVVVRPDSLTDESTVTPYMLCASPTRSALFDPGKASRVNVAHAMASLVMQDDLWHQWQGQMPVLYNATT